MKTTIVCGLLGSGKTTFILNALKGTTEKTVVLVNDFGAVGIDGEILSADGIESVELPSGCVCCTLKFDLITTIRRIATQFEPEHLVIEPSGVASPSGVLEALAGAGFAQSTVIGIVDATEFAELFGAGMYGSFFEDQIVHSDVILVNKSDIAAAHAVEAAERLIVSMNPRAILFRTRNAELADPLPAPRSRNPSVKRSAHFHFETLSFAVSGKPALADFSAFFHELAGGRFGEVVRAKALVATQEGPYRFDIVYGRVDTARFEKVVENSRLVVIGEGLDRRAVESAATASAIL